MIRPLNQIGKVILVTGASSGIGLATAIFLSQLGARIVLIARSKEALAAALAQLDGTGHRVESFDLSEAEAIPDLLKKLSSELGPISGLAHCAGFASNTTPADPLDQRRRKHVPPQCDCGLDVGEGVPAKGRPHAFRSDCARVVRHGHSRCARKICLLREQGRAASHGKVAGAGIGA